MSEGLTMHDAARLMEEAFRDGNYRPTVVGVVRDRRGRYLVVQSAKDGHTWYFPQGGIDSGETCIDAFYREMEEETGILRPQLSSHGLLRVEDIDAPSDRVDRRGFPFGKRYFAVLARYDGPVALSIDSSEVRAYSWLYASALVSRFSGTRKAKRDFMLRLARSVEGGV